MKKYFTFIKIEHTLFSLPVIYSGVLLGYLALFMSNGLLPSSEAILATCLWVLLAATGARTAGFALNRIIDRHIDARNPRTAMRDLPAKRMSLSGAYGVFISGLVAYLFAAWNLNDLCLYLSPVPIIVFGFYPFMKRFTIYAHFGVGLSLALGPLGGYFAVRPIVDELALPAILLSLFTWFWVSGFDIIYSTSDELFDRSEGLFSFPSRFGSQKALQYSALIHVVSFSILIYLYVTAFSLSIVALTLLLIIGVLFYLEHKKAQDVELAFFHINSVLGFVVLIFTFFGVGRIWQ
jgi:4-hydroxybenzoate polyprenyltransferase